MTLLIAMLMASGCQTGGNKPLTGHFDGYFEYKNKKLRAAVDFGYRNGKQLAFISVPDNLQLDKPFTTVEYNAPHIALKTDDGNEAITINATLQQNTIDGNISGRVPAALHLTKVEHYIPPAKSYSVEEVTLSSNGRRFSANLYLPKAKLPSASLIMIAGSGNHRKEEYNGAADLFASHGIATLTFDKRNVTTVQGLNIQHVNSDIASMKDLVSDVETALAFLKTRKQINQAKIGLMGFSLGAVEVPVVAANHSDISFVVAVSGNATTDREFIINQALKAYKKNGYDEQTLEKAERLYNDLFIYAKNRVKKDSLQLELDSAYKEGWGQRYFPREVPTQDELTYLLTWNNFAFDPAAYWKKVKVPCLLIYGDKDEYIPVERSIAILQRVFETKKELLTLKLYPNADHTIRIISKENNFEFPKYADGYINDVLTWLVKQVQ